MKVSTGAKIRNRYNQLPHLDQDTNGKVTNSQLDTTNERQEVSPFPAGDHKAHIINRRAQRHSKHKTDRKKNIKEVIFTIAGPFIDPNNKCMACECQSDGSVECDKMRCPNRLPCKKSLRVRPKGQCCKTCACVHNGQRYMPGKFLPIYTPGRRQSKTLLLSRNVDKNR